MSSIIMFDSFDGFDWDDGNLEKCFKHGVSLDEIEYVLAGKPIVAPTWVILVPKIGSLLSVEIV